MVHVNTYESSVCQLRTAFVNWIAELTNRLKGHSSSVTKISDVHREIRRITTHKVGRVLQRKFNRLDGGFHFITSFADHLICLIIMSGIMNAIYDRKNRVSNWFIGPQFLLKKYVGLDVLWPCTNKSGFYGLMFYGLRYQVFWLTTLIIHRSWRGLLMFGFLSVFILLQAAYNPH